MIPIAREAHRWLALQTLLRWTLFAAAAVRLTPLSALTRLTAIGVIGE